MRSKEEIRNEIIKLVDEYYENFHTVKPYQEGDRISYAGRCFGKEEIENLQHIPAVQIKALKEVALEGGRVVLNHTFCIPRVI